jgi:sortase A
MRTFRRRLGTTLMIAGVVLIVYAGLVVFWRDPVTDLYAIYSQRQMGSKLQAEEQQYVALAQQEQGVVAASIDAPPDPGAPQQTIAEKNSEKAIQTVFRLQKRFARQYEKHLGTPIGRIRIPAMGLSTIFVEGTDRWSSLSKGPGRYGNTSFPGSGATVGIAGHRTTFSAPFRHIDDLQKGDAVTLVMPYGTFTYRVRGHKVVKSNDWSIIKGVGHEQLVLSACHPLYSASHRWVVFADLVAIRLPGAPQTTPVSL